MFKPAWDEANSSENELVHGKITKNYWSIQLLRMAKHTYTNWVAVPLPPNCNN